MLIDSMKRGLIVSCQAHFDHPLNHAPMIAAMAKSAELGGAAGIRADGPEHIAEIKKQVGLPVIGIYKVHQYDHRFFITPTFEHARTIVEAGADIVALEASVQNRPDTEALGTLIRRIKEELHTPVMADVSTFEEGERAWRLGADFVGTTLSGYTKASAGRALPDIALVKQLTEAGIRAVCEGHVGAPEQALAAIEAGAYFVVVGTAITDPIAITRQFAGKLQPYRAGRDHHAHR
ncbi:N-acetylmannosamine-6-phosphate 2-epimerase [Paenibacillus macerans]|uniref:N-acetylmannosamine-6-phosphate 2-epimerase n=1 Tax=Paenibacillus macerans TaxID=44252 RepID=UPI002041455D|nr:N-acetylmannosamine-6-phosphate 2-epimerase [Paenibacillus macerans]MCM3703640.1 N-acetylmannosamine-6-phosphate 2-epimerase [Paenibacillus macerans]